MRHFNGLSAITGSTDYIPSRVLPEILMSLLRSFVLVGCMAGLAVTAPTAMAQQARVYAPENLKTLSVNDRTRVISQEYGEQSRGRQIPNDQLEVLSGSSATFELALQPDQVGYRHLVGFQWWLATAA